MAFQSTNDLFLQQSYDDIYETYENSLAKKNFVHWDYIIITASNQRQADTYRRKIEQRLLKKRLPSVPNYAVVPDTDGKRIGSGGATLNALLYVLEKEGTIEQALKKRILLIHSGGDSKRIPQYSDCGKLFSPVERELAGGFGSTLFDEVMILASSVPSRMSKGLFVLSGDVLLLFNPLQVEFSSEDAASLSIKETVEIGKNHGVFVADSEGYVQKFLHKSSVQSLEKEGAIDRWGFVNLDSGAVYLGKKSVEALISLVTTDGKKDDQKANLFINEQVALNFYGDILYPLAKTSEYEKYLLEKPEKEFSQNLELCRKEIWDKLSPLNLKLSVLAPAKFIHFGTSSELIQLKTTSENLYKNLGWKNSVVSFCDTPGIACYNSLVEQDVVFLGDAYIENSHIKKGVTIGDKAIVSNIVIESGTIPQNTVVHALKQTDGSFVVRIYPVSEDAKNPSSSSCSTSLWELERYPKKPDMQSAFLASLAIYNGEKPSDDAQLLSLSQSFLNANSAYSIEFEQTLSEQIRVEKFLHQIKLQKPLQKVKQLFEGIGLSDSEIQAIANASETLDFSQKTRSYYYISKLCDNRFSEMYEAKAFETIRKVLFDDAFNSLSLISEQQYNVTGEKVEVELPVRVNFGGGWSDTPPHCLEQGGTVLNAAVLLNGEPPVFACIERIDKRCIVLETADNHKKETFYDISQLQNYGDPFDPFALLKAALIVAGVVSLEQNASFENLIDLLGGGIHIKTGVKNIPRGSGLGTSSILAAAVVTAIFKWFSIEKTKSEISQVVLSVEQLMSTGGGWQDQCGAIFDGVKLLETDVGINQIIRCKTLSLAGKTQKELSERLCLIYTGQRRLARNLLREIVGKYLSGDETAVSVLGEIQRVSRLMANRLQNGDIDGFAELLSRHMELSLLLDKGSANICINHIFSSIDDLVVGKMVCGAGGGGFLQVILKKGVTRAKLSERLSKIYSGTGIDVWESEIAF